MPAKSQGRRSLTHERHVIAKGILQNPKKCPDLLLLLLLSLKILNRWITTSCQVVKKNFNIGMSSRCVTCLKFIQVPVAMVHVSIIPSGQKKKHRLLHTCLWSWAGREGGANVSYALFVDAYAEVMVRCSLFKSLSSQVLLLFKALHKKKKKWTNQKKEGEASPVIQVVDRDEWKQTGISSPCSLSRLEFHSILGISQNRWEYPSTLFLSTLFLWKA